jgi:hypothetical protein
MQQALQVGYAMLAISVDLCRVRKTVTRCRLHAGYHRHTLALIWLIPEHAQPACFKARQAAQHRLAARRGTIIDQIAAQSQRP